MQLIVLDWCSTSAKFEAFIIPPTHNRCNQFKNSVIDDVKCFKVDCHTVMISFKEETSESSSFKVLAVSSSGSK